MIGGHAQNERLLSLTAVALDLFEALDPPALAAALRRGVGDLCRGASAELSACTDDAAGGDAFLRDGAAQAGVLLAPDGYRAAAAIPGPSGTAAYVLDIRACDAPFTEADAFAFGILRQYLAVAVRNVEFYRELEARRAAVIELNAVKNDLIAMLAHDFKGPLTTIVGLAEVLAEDERFDAESRRLLSIINASALRLASLASDTLTLSHLEHNELSLRFEPVDLVGLVRDIVRVLGVTRTIDLRAGSDAARVLADPARLRQVFENVIGNAIKYSPRGESVSVSVRERNDGVEVAVRDRGIGIPAADLPRLFGRFARGSNARELGIGGTGFGLYLSRTIVELHGGRIEVESVEGTGSTFRVIVPAVPLPQRMRDRRILVLDREGGRSFIAHALRDEGYAVYPVVDEVELLRTLDTDRYDAALIDVDRLGIAPDELAAGIAQRTAVVWIASSAAHPPTGGSVLRKPFFIKDLQTVVGAAVADRRRGPRRGGTT